MQISWPAGKPAPYQHLADTFENVANESKRIVITEQLVRCLRALLKASPKDVLPAVYLCINAVAPVR